MSYMSRFSPIPVFPEYTGPHKVGTVDVEIPVSELESPSAPPEHADDIHTVQFRVFYPAEPTSNGKRIWWLPNPQRQHVSGYTKFIGAGPFLSELLSFLPRHLHYTSIPVHKNANILAPDTPNKRWPTVLFSHGLGGSRNAYSHLAGSLASHGAVVVCPEHRDGSAVMSFIRIPGEQDRYFKRRTRKEVPYRKLSHDVSPEIFQAREEQLRIRMWELGLVHDAMLAIDKGDTLSNLNTSTPSLEPLVGKLNIHEPGSLIFCGHSFGGATITQFLKSTYYAGSPELAAMEKPLFVPREDSAIRKQVTERTITMLLDMWCMPLLAPNSAPLFKFPLPAYADVPTAAGGTALLAIESETFYNWKEHLHTTARILSPEPSAEVVTPSMYERPSGIRLPEPNFFYVINSAHLSQSDFGILFPWLTKMIFNAVEPERALRLNLRAQLQVLRANNVPIARTWYGDLVEGAHLAKEDIPTPNPGDHGVDDGLHNDEAILERSKSGRVSYWSWIDTVGLGGASGSAKASASPDANMEATKMEANEDIMEREAEPAVESSKVTASAAA